MESFYDIGGDIDSVSEVSSERNSTPFRLSYNDIASKLISDKLFLTALELHSELIEAGKELPKLRDFFSNPGNFEFQSRADLSPSIPRSSSQATLDSLDFTRYSEDGERAADDRVAVLEFELRKANEKINALRANLTVATECETPIGDVPDGSFLNDPIKPHEQRALNFLINEYLLMKGYKLTSITFSDQNEDQDFEDWDDVGLNIPKPAGLLHVYRIGIRNQAALDTVSSESQTDVPFIDETFHTNLVEENNDLKEKLLISQKEKLELIIDCESYDKDKEKETVSVSTQSDLVQQSSLSSSEKLTQTDDPCDVDLHLVPLTKEAVRQIEEAVNNLKNVTLSSGFEKEIWKETSLSEEWSGLSNVTNDVLIQVVSPTLINIAQAIPLNNKQWVRDMVHILVYLILLNPNEKQKDELMQCLLNLKKRPQDDERQLILSGLVRICRGQESKDLVEAHLMPQCWDLMNNKYVEKRILVVQICSQIALYIPSELRNSLLVSILQQLLLEDKEEVVRVQCIHSLALIGAFIEDPAKYSQLEEITVKALEDPSEKVVEVLLQLLLPVIGKWALELDKLRNCLLPSVLSLIEKQLQGGEARRLSGVRAFTCLLPHLVMYVATSAPCTEQLASLPPAQHRVGFGSLCTGLSNPVLFYQQKGDMTVSTVMKAFDHSMKNKQSWDQLDWLLSKLMTRLLDIVDQVDPMNEEGVLLFVKMFRSLCAGFGTLLAIQVKEMFEERLDQLEESLMDISRSWPLVSLMPIYLLGIMIPLQVSSREEIGERLERFLMCIAVCGAPLQALSITFRETCKASDLVEPLMASIWKGVVNPRSEVKCCAAQLLSDVVPFCNEQVITSRIVPALITLASDPNLLVRVSTISTFGIIIEYTKSKEVVDKITIQIQSIVSDPSLAENHTSLVKVISALGKAAPHCDIQFREEVILGSLARFVDLAAHSGNNTCRSELAEYLVEAYSNTIYSHITPSTITHILLPALRQLVGVCTECLSSHVETVRYMESEVESRNTPSTPIPRSSSNLSIGLTSPNVEEMKQKVTKMFTSPISKKANLPNIPNLFKKK